MTGNDLPTPSMGRRLACFAYEGVLLFGVVMVVGLLYGVLTQQRHALIGTHGLQAAVFAALGCYFVWFWSQNGQTLAMQTWHVRLLGPDNQPPSWQRALGRYLLSWLWFMPALATVHFMAIGSAGSTAGALLAGVLIYAALSFLRRDRQFLHDAVCGTRLVTWRPAPRQNVRA
jgi:uncharacterized RDD family membrane protein YckC